MQPKTKRPALRTAYAVLFSSAEKLFSWNRWRWPGVLAHLVIALTRSEITWRARALLSAARSLVNVGGTDLAASLAYYSLLSFVPFVSLVVLISASFIDLDPLRRQLSLVIGIYFPVSQEFLDTAITPLFDARPVVGAISVVAMIWGANGLFRATNRTVNRAFGSEQRQPLGIALAELTFAGGIISLLFLSITISGFFRIATDVTDELALASQLLGELSSHLIRILLAAVPPVVTFSVFLLVYRAVPNSSVPWRDATFGAVTALTLFEGAKYAFFWIGSQVGSQSLVYGPLSSVVILLIWSQMAALFFLYGVSVTRESIRLRP